MDGWLERMVGQLGGKLDWLVRMEEPRRSGYGRLKESGGKITSGTTQTEGDPPSSNNHNSQRESNGKNVGLVREDIKLVVEECWVGG